jgi:translation initiation factor 1 (eIF-1/SUI1)
MVKSLPMTLSESGTVVENSVNTQGGHVDAASAAIWRPISPE